MRHAVRVMVALAALGVCCLALPAVAEATHFRYGNYSWQPAGGNTIDFSLQAGFRRSANPCVDTTTNTTVPCTAPDGSPAVGDVIVEFTGGTTFNAGDGTVIGSPRGPLYFQVTAIDPANDWLQGSALDPASLPARDPLVTHTYAATGNYTAFTASCCRLSGGSGHINNPDGSYTVQTLVNVGTQGANASPVSAMPTIVLCQQNSVCTFLVPGADPNGDPLRFRLSTATEAGPGFVQPGPPHAPNAATIDPVTGVYTWNTTGATLASSGATLYSTQVTIEDRDAAGSVKSKIAVDFLIQLVPFVPGNPPRFDHPPTPACGSTLSVQAGNALAFTVQASDTDTGAVVTLNAAGLPPGATMSPPLPTSGNPVSSSFSWTPTSAQVGVYVVTFTATDNTGQQALCSFTIEVTAVPVGPKPLDHFKCYRGTAAATHPAAGIRVALEDQFGRSKATMAKVYNLCNPADKNGEGVNVPEGHLVEYKLVDRVSASKRFPKYRVRMENQFGDVTLVVRRPDRLMVASSKAIAPTVPPPLAAKLDNYLCYKVQSWAGYTARWVTLADQFVTQRVHVRKPRMMCNPVSTNGEAIVNKKEHLVCYVAHAPGRPGRWTVNTVSEFGTTSIVADKVRHLCVPSSKTIL